MKSKFKKTTAILLLVVMVCSMLAGCAEKKPAPEDTIKKFQDAINRFDVEALLSCLDSELAEQIRPILALSVGEDGISVEKFFSVVKSIIPILPFVSKGTVQAEDLPKVALTVTQTEQDEDTAVVSLSGVLNWGGFNKSFSTTVKMELENDMWVICGIQ